MGSRGGREPWFSWELKEGLTNQEGDFQAEAENRRKHELVPGHSRPQLRVTWWARPDRPREGLGRGPGPGPYLSAHRTGSAGIPAGGSEAGPACKHGCPTPTGEVLAGAAGRSENQRLDPGVRWASQSPQHQPGATQGQLQGRCISREWSSEELRQGRRKSPTLFSRVLSDNDKQQKSYALA